MTYATPSKPRWAAYVLLQPYQFQSFAHSRFPPFLYVLQFKIYVLFLFFWSLYSDPLVRSLGVPFANAGVPLNGDVPPWRPPGMVRSLNVRGPPDGTP